MVSRLIILIPTLVACSLVRDLDDLPGPSGGGKASCLDLSPPGNVQTDLSGPTAPFKVPSSYLGMHVSPTDPNGGSAIAPPKYPYGYIRNFEVGSGSNLVQRGFWQSIETAEAPQGQPGVFEWKHIDAWMDANPGHPVIWMIYGTPTFYQKYSDQNDVDWGGDLPRGLHNPPSDEKHYALARYAQAVKARYGARIAAFEVWHEPTLSYGDAGNYSKRCDDSITDENVCPVAHRYFSGSASDLANIAYTLNSAGLDVPILGGGFVDQWGGGQHSVSRFLDAPVTLPGGSGTGKDHVQALSIHFLDYNFTPADLADHIDGYQQKLKNSGVGSLSLWLTQSAAAAPGVFGDTDDRAPTNIKRWAMIGAAKQLQSYVLYAHADPTTARQTLSDPVHNPAVQAAISARHELGGKTICEAYLLTDGRVWLVTAEDGALVE